MLLELFKFSNGKKLACKRTVHERIELSAAINRFRFFFLARTRTVFVRSIALIKFLRENKVDYSLSDSNATILKRESALLTH
jgi:hypothetical protein